MMSEPAASPSNLYVTSRSMPLAGQVGTMN